MPEGRSPALVDITRHRGQFSGSGTCALIPAGARHHVKNAGAGPLFFLTIYAPPAY